MGTEAAARKKTSEKLVAKSAAVGKVAETLQQGHAMPMPVVPEIHHDFAQARELLASEHLPPAKQQALDELLAQLPPEEKSYLLKQLIGSTDDALQLKGIACAAQTRMNQVISTRPGQLTTIASYRDGDVTYRLRRNLSGDYWYQYAGSNKNKKSGYLGKDCPSLRAAHNIPQDLELS